MNYYEILEIDSGASKDQIERAFRRLARKVHPDLSGGDTGRADARMKQLNEIRDTLTDPLLRAGYDERLRLEALQSPPPAAKPSRRAAPRAEEPPDARRQRRLDLGAPGGEPRSTTSGKRLVLLALGAALVASAVIISLPREGLPLPPGPAVPAGPPGLVPAPPVALEPTPAPPPAPRPARVGAHPHGVVHIGSTIAQVLRAFGAPDRVEPGAREGDATFHYGKLRLEISNGRVTGGDAAVR
jgi:hypothetical protein